MTLRIGIIGATGHIGYVVDGIRELPDARICAIAPGGPEESLDNIRSRVHAPTDVAEFADFRNLLDRAKPDIVAVSPQFHRHATVTCETLRRGIPVYCEKPLALTLESLDAVRVAQRVTGASVGMMLAFRYAPAFVAAQSLVAAGRIGEPSFGFAQKSYKRGIARTSTGSATPSAASFPGSAFMPSIGFAGSAAGSSRPSRPATPRCSDPIIRNSKTRQPVSSRRTTGAARS